MSNRNRKRRTARTRHRWVTRKGLPLLQVAAALMSLGLAGSASVGGQTSEPAVQLTFLDVGQADAIVIQSPEGRTAIVDAGSGDVLRFLAQLGIEEVDLLVASHAHADHIGGMDEILTARPVHYYMDNGQTHPTATYERVMATLTRLSGVIYLEAVPRTISLGSIDIEVLPLPPVATDQNNRSVGLVVRFGDFEALLSGDSEREELTFWVESGVVPDVEVLKAPHHGSVDGFTVDFLDAADPEAVVISVGADNAYGHPRPEALTAFGSVADAIYRTDRDGHITVLGYPDGRFDVVLDGGVVERPPADIVSPLEVAALEIRVTPGEGPDEHSNLNDEFVVLVNGRPEPVEIGGWRICDLSTRCFRFPPGSRIEGDRRVVVYTGYGMADGVSFFMNNNRAVWNNNGDEASLYDVNGSLVLRLVY